MKPGTLVRIVVSVVALGLVGWFLRGELSEAVRILKTEVRFGFLAAALAVYFFSFLILTARMQVILHAKKIFFGFIDVLYLSFMGLFFSLFLPSAIGGDVMKAVFLAKHAESKADVFSCLVMDRLMGCCIVLLMAFGCSAFIDADWNPIPHWASYSFLAAAFIAGTATFIRPEWIVWFFSKLKFLPHKIQEKVNQFYDSLTGFFHNRALLIKTLLLSLLAQSMFIVSYYFIGRSLDAPVPLAHFFFLIPMITIVSMTPSVGGAGVREAGALFLFKMYMPAERALAMTVLIDVVILLYSFAGGIWYLVRGHGRARMPNS